MQTPQEQNKAPPNKDCSGPGFDTLDKAERKDVLQVAEDLSGAFIWSDSREGDEYWRKIHDRLVQISQDGRI